MTCGRRNVPIYWTRNSQFAHNKTRLYAKIKNLYCLSDAQAQQNVNRVCSCVAARFSSSLKLNLKPGLPGVPNARSHMIFWCRARIGAGWNWHFALIRIPWAAASLCLIEDVCTSFFAAAAADHINLVRKPNSRNVVTTFAKHATPASEIRLCSVLVLTFVETRDDCRFSSLVCSAGRRRTRIIALIRWFMILWCIRWICMGFYRAQFRVWALISSLKRFFRVLWHKLKEKFNNLWCLPCELPCTRAAKQTFVCACKSNFNASVELDIPPHELPS